ncbi:MAG: CocE/NonD family hydrolase [Nevskiales bacterium]
MKQYSLRLGVLTPVLACLFLLAACSNGDSDGLALGGSGGASAQRTVGKGVASSGDNASCVSRTHLEGARSYQVTLPSASGETISFQVFEPATFNCRTGHELVLHGHGFGGSRQTTRDGFIGELLERGYGVISIDARGFGDSTGTVRTMDPDFEGKDYLAILDWAEANLDWLVYEGGNLVSGAIGGSYGGGYQLLIHNIDPQHRLDALSPDITWNDLTYSLNPGDTVKSSWGLLLTAAGEAGANQPLIDGLDPTQKETLVRAVAENNFPQGALNFYRYHSPRYYFDGGTDGEQSFLLDPLFGPQSFGTPANLPVKVDILFSQGIRDTLFNFNDAWRNFESYRALGGDVRLLTHESGHILPVSTSALPGLEGALDPLSELGVHLPDFQLPGGDNRCGTLDRNAATLAFFNEKLKRRPADPLIAQLKNQVCFSLDGNHALYVKADQVKAPPRGEVLPGAPEIAVTNGLPVPVGALALATVALGPSVIPLKDIGAGGDVLAGIATVDLDLTHVAGVDGCEQSASIPQQLPLSVACDAIIYLGLGVQRAGAGSYDLIDDQITPVRGLGQHVVELVGVAEGLNEGDKLALLVYGYHLQYPTSITRDVLVPAVNIAASVRLPLTGIAFPAGAITGGDDGEGGASGFCVPGLIPVIGGQCLPI